MLWLAQAWKPGVTIHDLTYEDDRYVKISALLAYELEKTCPAWLRKHINDINNELAQHGGEINGRQIVHMIIDSLNFDDNLADIVNI